MKAFTSPYVKCLNLVHTYTDFLKWQDDSVIWAEGEDFFFLSLFLFLFVYLSILSSRTVFNGYLR